MSRDLHRENGIVRGDMKLNSPAAGDMARGGIESAVDHLAESERMIEGNMTLTRGRSKNADTSGVEVRRTGIDTGLSLGLDPLLHRVLHALLVRSVAVNLRQLDMHLTI